MWGGGGVRGDGGGQRGQGGHPPKPASRHIVFLFQHLLSSLASRYPPFPFCWLCQHYTHTLIHTCIHGDKTQTDTLAAMSPSSSWAPTQHPNSSLLSIRPPSGPPPSLLSCQPQLLSPCTAPTALPPFPLLLFPIVKPLLCFNNKRPIQPG